MSETLATVAAGEAAATAAVAEVQADAAVEIAAIEADARVAVETLAQETAQTALAAGAQSEEEDILWLRAELTGLQERCATNAAGLSALEAGQVSLSAQMGELTAGLMRLSILSPPSEPEPEQIPTPEPEPPAAVPDGPRAESEAASDAAAVSAAPRPRRRWL
jgi:hypothetical protein